jgi:hypothetical protein
MSTAEGLRRVANSVNLIDVYDSRVMTLVKKAATEGKYFIDVDFAQFEMPSHVIGSLEMVLREKGLVVHPANAALYQGPNGPVDVKGNVVEGYMMRINW